jgi:hypothetical protein
LSAGEIDVDTQKQTFRNDSSHEIEVYVEAWPDRYVLQPKDELTIETELSNTADPFYVVVTERGLQVYPGGGTAENAWLNGEPAEQNWDGAN